MCWSILDDPVLVLKRINEEWLAENGRFFLVCPNANAPSRQIAVKMGLITHNAAVTPAEAEHGHRRTYSLDTLERDAVAAGLKVIHRSGDLLQGTGELSVGSIAANRHHFQGISGRMLQAGAAVPGSVFEHLLDVRARSLAGLEVT